MSERRGAGSAIPPLTHAEALELARMLVPTPTAEQVDEVQYRFGLVAALHRQWSSQRRAVSPSATRKELAAVSRAAHRLLARLGAGVDSNQVAPPVEAMSKSSRLSLLSAGDHLAARAGGYADFPPIPRTIPGVEGEFWDFRSNEKLKSVIGEVEQLITWCDEAIASSHAQSTALEDRRIARSGPKGRHARHRGDVATDHTVLHVAELYRQLAGRKPGISRPRQGLGQPGGPFVRFALAVCARMGVPMTAEGLEKRWRRISRP